MYYAAIMGHDHVQGKWISLSGMLILFHAMYTAEYFSGVPLSFTYCPKASPTQSI